MYVFTGLLGIYYIISKALTSGVVLSWNFLWNKYWTFRQKHFEKFETIKEPEFDLSIVIPAYNEEKRLPKTLDRVISYFRWKDMKVEIIVVDDWSKDKTAEVAKAQPSVRYVTYDCNKWKWFAVKTWIKEAKWKLILFSDADLSTPIEEYEKLSKFIVNHDIVIWSRYIDWSDVQIKQSLFRVFIWRLGNLVIQTFLIDGINDTQCGFKLFKSDVAKDIASYQKVERWWFDMEMLHIAEKFWYTIKEVWVDWLNDGDSKLSPIKDTIKTFKELVYIKFNSLFDGYKK